MTTIRPASTSDASAIAGVHVEGWQTAYRGILTDEYLDSLSIDQRVAFWKQHLHREPHLIFVAEDPRRGIVGFAFAGHHHGSFGEYQGEIHAIYVLEQYQRHGIGRALFHQSAAALAEADYSGMMIWALKQNPYRRFYEKLGGKLLGEETTCIGNRELQQVAYGWPQIAAVVTV